MMSGPGRRGYGGIPYAVLAVVVFGLYFGHAWARLDPSLIYHEQRPIFRVGRSFFTGHLEWPGGVVAYTAALLCQVCSVPWAGAVMLTVLAACVCVATAAYIAAMGGPRFHPASFVPAVLLAVLHNRYEHPLTTDVGLMAAMAGALVVLSASRRRAGMALPVFVPVAAVVFVAAGGPFLLTASLCILHALLVSRRVWQGAGQLLWSIALPYLFALIIWRSDPLGIHGRLLPWEVRDVPVAEVALYILLPVLGIGAWWWGCRRKASAAGTVLGEGPDPRGLASWICQALVLVAGGAALVTFTFDRQAQALARIDCGGLQAQWEPILAEAARLPGNRYELTTHWDVNRALFHTGRLRDEMFGYPQHPDSLLMDNQEKTAMALPEDVRMHLGGVLLDLGRVAEAEHITQEALENLGEYPLAIRRLALIYMVKQEPDAAKVFLNALREHLLYRSWAEDRLARLRRDPLMGSDDEVGRIREVMIRIDHLGHVPVELMLKQLLDANRQNRMAFEYLMGYYLLIRQVGRVAQELGRLDDFGIEGIPPYYEEAIMLHVKATRDTSVDLHSRTIRRETIERFRAFFETLSGHEGNERAAREAMAGAYGNTYLYYHTFGRSGDRPVVARGG